ncbi:leucine-rich repeat protein, partial [Ruminococcus sp.]|uniref:leucine-rich repeat protein n=1 Tax=Ruminococcus sp. TaxID=41978 RepID=UPI002609CCC1
EENCSTADGYKGYFWMSYETPLSCVASYEMQSVDEFDNIYQHQITSYAGFDVDSAANVFTAKYDEVLKQVCFQTGGAADVKIEIHKLNSSFTSPQDGELLASFDASFDFKGIHTVDCPENIRFSAGDTFSVVVISKSDLFLNFKVNSDNEVSGRSYCIANGGSWADVADKWEYGYAAIKAYTSNDGEVNKTELEELVKTGEELTPDKDVSAEILEELNASLNSAKELLNDENATQNSIDNEYCLLKCSVDKVKNFTFTVNSVDDYYRLIDKVENNSDSSINKIVLNADLDFGGKEIQTIFTKNQFSGIFDGNGHKMSNFVINSKGTYNSGLFGGLYKATVQNIIFENCSVVAEDCATLISNYCTDSVIKNCDVTNCKVNANSAAIIGEYLSECDLTNLCITNSKVYGAYSAGLYFINGFETTTENCTAKGVELYSENMVYDGNMTVSLLSSSEGSMPRIKLADGKCTVESFIGIITSAKANGKQLSDDGNVYVVDDTSGDVYLDIVCDMSDCGDYGVTGNLETGELYLLSYNGDSPEMIIPAEIFGKKLSGFSEYFSSNITYSDKITSITIPGDIKSISEDTFTGMPALKKVVVEEGVEKLEGGAFSECYELTDVKLPDSLESIGGYAFGNCTKLKNIEFGSSLCEIGERAFYNCVSLCDLILPDSVKKISIGAFSHCGFKSVTLGRNIEEIGENAFAYTGMSELDYKSVRVPDFVINGYSDTAAKSYADKYGLEFVDLEKQERVATGELFDYGVFIKGDVNLDGTVSILDVTLIEKWLVGDAELSQVQRCNAIVGQTFDKININSATEIQRYIAGLIDSLGGSAAG